MFSQGTFYRDGATDDQYKDAGGANLPIETVTRKSFIEQLQHEKIPELYIETYCNECRQLTRVDVLPLTCSLFLQYLCYNKLGNRQKCDESLYEISLFIQYDDGHHLNKNDLTVPWRILGICQQMSGDYRSAFRSYYLSLRDDIGEYHRRHATFIRIGALLANFF